MRGEEEANFTSIKAASARPGRGSIARSLSAALGFLQRSQLPHGEFRTYACPDDDMAEACEFDSSPFSTSLIAYSIGHADDPRAQEMTAPALDFLASEMEGPGLWRYWSASHPRHRLLPPDLDDTSCISFMLQRHHRPPPSNREILLANRNRQGAFYTWLAPRSGSLAHLLPDADDLLNLEALLLVSLFRGLDDVDCAVNANVLMYLGESEDTRGAIDYLVDLVLNGEEAGCSRFYPDVLSFYYMLSRACVESVPSLKRVRVPVLERVVAAQAGDGSFGSALLTALAACTLLNLDHVTAALHGAIAYLLQAQRGDGSWPRTPMYLGPAPYYGSEELTTGFCVEALARYRPMA